MVSSKFLTHKTHIIRNFNEKNTVFKRLLYHTEELSLTFILVLCTLYPTLWICLSITISQTVQKGYAHFFSINNY